MNTLATFGNIFGLDTMVVFFLVLLLFGAKKLPELAKGLGQAVREFSKAKDDFHDEITRPPTPPEPPKQIEPAVVEVAKETQPHTTEHTVS